MTRSAYLLLTVVSWMPTSPALLAQDADASQADSIAADSVAAVVDSIAADTISVDRARSMLVSMNALVDSIYALDAETREAGQAAHELARVQMGRQVDRITALEEELLELIPALAAEGPVADSIAMEFGAFLSREAEMYDTGIQRYVDRIQGMRDQRSTTPLDSLDVLEIDMRLAKARLDSLLVMRMDVLTAADELGIETAAEWEQVDRYLRNLAETLVGRLQIAVIDRDRI